MHSAGNQPVCKSKSLNASAAHHVKNSLAKVVANASQFEPPVSDSLYWTDNTTPDDPERHRNFKHVQESLKETMNLMSNVIDILRMTVRAWNTFKVQDAPRFSNLTFASGRQESVRNLLHEIGGHFTRLEAMCATLEDRKRRLEVLAKQVRTSPSTDRSIRDEADQMDRFSQTFSMTPSSLQSNLNKQMNLCW